VGFKLKQQCPEITAFREQAKRRTEGPQKALCGADNFNKRERDRQVMFNNF
jgi:hypothetical protein